MPRRKHLHSTRLYCNAGITFPRCAENEPLLDLDKSAWPMADQSTPVEMICKRCLSRLPARARLASYLPAARRAD